MAGHSLESKQGRDKRIARCSLLIREEEATFLSKLPLKLPRRWSLATKSPKLF